MQTSDHWKRQVAGPVEDLRDAPTMPDVGLEVAATHTKLIHPEEDCIDGVRGINGEVLFLVRFDQCREDLESVALRRARRGLPEALDLGKSGFVISFGTNRLDVHSVSFASDIAFGLPRNDLRS